jgi:uncharacterized protein
LVGSALVGDLRAAGNSVSRLVRTPETRSSAERLIHWNPERGVIDAAALENHDAVVHLAGESLIGLWTEAKKARIRESRVRGTALLSRALATLQQPPAVFISASAVGYYGDHPASEQVDENTPAGRGFLAEVVEAWEGATAPAQAARIRVVCTRFGLVLSPRGGSLAVMLPIFQLGLGGKVGSGEQVWSWIALPDVVSGITHAIAQPTLRGPVNFTAPGAVTNAEFTRTLAQVLNRPAIFAAPAFALRLVVRGMADEMLLGGARVLPRKLQQSGYTFRHPELEGALRALLRR